jgi:hypothetical protein
MNRFTCNVLLNMRSKMQISSTGPQIERWHGCALKLRRLTSFNGTTQAVERSQYSASHLQTKGKDAPQRGLSDIKKPAAPKNMSPHKKAVSENVLI